MHAKIKYNGIVAYTLLNIHKEIHKFLQVLKEMHTEKAGSFFLPHGEDHHHHHHRHF